MKLSYIASAAILALGLGCASCTDNDYMELDKGSDTLTLTASTTEIVLEESEYASDAIELSWSTGTNYGTGNRILYTLQLAAAGTNFADPVTIYDGESQEYSWTPMVDQLNALAINRLGAEPYEAYQIEARVLATVAGVTTDQSSIVTFTVTPYKAVATKLYLIGDATPNGWSADNATEMAKTSTGIFTWTGNLAAGEFKFITTLGQFLPSYNNDGNGGLVYRDSDDQPDEKFVITEAHCYKVDVNLLELTITITEVEGIAPAYSELYFVGDVTSWTFWEMTQDPLDPFLFRIGVFFTGASEFKFGTTSGSWENMYKAAEENAPYTNTEMQFISGFDPDPKWYLTASEANQAYKICVDIRTDAERMLMAPYTPYTEMYLVGDATPNGWDLGNATAMTVDPSDANIFTWSGYLNAGELKFSADKQSDWNGAWFMADEEGKVPTGSEEHTLFIDKTNSSCQDQYKDILVGNIDYKWVIESAGNYTITLNQLYQTVTIKKQ
ncbi:MAG: SusF/SusE family outer membrane protein [Bacteroidales bacterium]|nr:SusF/SusE family outer membrane protein [Bacteroidales bacterium]